VNLSLEVGVDKRGFPSQAWYPIGFVFSLAVLGVGIYLATLPKHDWTVMAAGCVCLAAVAVAWPLCATLRAQAMTDRQREAALTPVNERLDQMAMLLNLLSEQLQLSDRAKAVAFRVKDRDALRRAVQEEMGRHDWEAAMSLADEIEKAFGYKGEADRLRGEIRDRQDETMRNAIDEVVAVIDQHTRGEQWNAAIREAEKLISTYPNNEQVRNLPLEIDVRRQAFKKQLRMQWDEAVARHDVDTSIEALKRLDPYLTPAEAEEMQETARGIFKEKLNNLSADFARAVHDQHWTDAVRIGEAVIRDFPNSRIAQEIRQNIEGLRQRGHGEPAAVGA
jgi:hypothetical protein